jgi:hypothetical protein
MNRRSHVVAMVLVLGALALAAPAAAQQQLSLNIGYFALRGEGSRVAGDTLVANLTANYPFAMGYKISDFNNVTFGGEWLIPVGEFLEAGVGVSYYRKTVPSYFVDLVDNSTGRDITQDLRLRTTPITATLRWVPTGRRATVQPYLGAGLAIIPWSYSENGDFVDSAYNTFTYEYKDSGTAVGPVLFGGLRVRASRTIAVGGEIRWQLADSALNPDVGFQGTRIDLGGFTYAANVTVRF